jgi:hypothetical protein
LASFTSSPTALAAGSSGRAEPLNLPDAAEQSSKQSWPESEVPMAVAAVEAVAEAAA